MFLCLKPTRYVNATVGTRDQEWRRCTPAQYLLAHCSEVSGQLCLRFVPRCSGRETNMAEYFSMKELSFLCDSYDEFYGSSLPPRKKLASRTDLQVL
jgi:hypothetical protein